MSYFDYPDRLNKLSDLFTYVNSLKSAEGWFGFMIPFTVFIVLLLSFMSYRLKFRHSVTAASFITVLVAVLLRAGSYLSDAILTLYITIFLGSVLMEFIG